MKTWTRGYHVPLKEDCLSALGLEKEGRGLPSVLSEVLERIGDHLGGTYLSTSKLPLELWEWISINTGTGSD